MAAVPQYAAAPKCGMAQIATANAARDGTGTLGTVFTAGASGSRIDAILLKATAATTAGMVRLFVSDGTNHRLITELPVQAQTPSGTAPGWEAQLTTGNLSQVLPLVMPNGYSLRASTHNAESFNVIALGGDF